MKSLIDKLNNEHTLRAEEYRSLLLCEDAETNSYLRKKAQQTTLDRFGNAVFIRGLIEITDAETIVCIAASVKAIRGSPVTLYLGKPYCHVVGKDMLWASEPLFYKEVKMYRKQMIGLQKRLLASVRSFPIVP